MIKTATKETILKIINTEIKKELKNREKELEGLSGARKPEAAKINLKFLEELIEAKADLLSEGSRRRGLIETIIINEDISGDKEKLEQLKKYSNFLIEIEKKDREKKDNREKDLKTNINLTKDFYTIQEAADILQVHTNTIRNNIKSGKIKAFRIGSQWRISRKELI